MKSKYLEPLAVLVAGGTSIKTAAGAVGCSEQTAYNLSATSEFRQKVSEIRSQMTASAVGKLSAAATQAVDTLMELLSPEHEPAVRLNSAKAILNSVAPFAEHNELRQRISDIETRAHLKVMR